MSATQTIIPEAAMSQSATISRGAVVEYHGSITPEHGTHVVTTVHPNGKLDLHLRDYPNFTLKTVRPTSVTPSGETVDLCACGHEFDWNQRVGKQCDVVLCPCATHMQAPVLGTVITAGPWISGTKQPAALGYVVIGDTEPLYPDSVVAWFPTLGAPGVSCSTGRIYLREIEDVQALATMPNKWVTSAYNVARKDQTRRWHNWSAAGMALETAAKAILRAQREAMQARRDAIKHAA